MNPQVRKSKEVKANWRAWRGTRVNGGRNGRVKERVRRPRRGE